MVAVNRGLWKLEIYCLTFCNYFLMNRLTMHSNLRVKNFTIDWMFSTAGSGNKERSKRLEAKYVVIMDFNRRADIDHRRQHHSYNYFQIQSYQTTQNCNSSYATFGDLRSTSDSLHSTSKPLALIFYRWVVGQVFLLSLGMWALVCVYSDCLSNSCFNDPEDSKESFKSRILVFNIWTQNLHSSVHPFSGSTCTKT